MTDTITAATDLVDLEGPIHDRMAAGILKGRVLFAMDASGYLTMWDDPQAPPGWQDQFVVNYGGESFLAIRDRSIVEIVLTGPTQWEFDLDGGLLRFKRASNERWYRVTYSQSQNPLKNILLHATSSGLQPGSEAARHGFNLMIKIGYMPMGGMPGRPLPVIIDPDAKNPPPNGSFTNPSSGPVPVLTVGV